MKKDVAWYVGELKRARKKRSLTAREYEWGTLKDTVNTAGMYVETVAGSYKQVETPHSDSGYVNWPWAYKEAFVPSVYSRHPQVYAFPTQPLHKVNAKNVQANVNATMDEINISEEVKRAIVDCLVYGHGWVKLGWYTKYGQLPVGAGQAGGDKQSEIDVNSGLIEDSAYAYRVSPEQMLVDPEATRYEDVRWVAQEYFHPLDLVKADPFLKHTKNISAMTYGSRDDDIPSIFEKPTEGKVRQWTRVYEIWDKEEDKVLTICEGTEKFNRVQNGWPYHGIRGFPFKLLTLNTAIDKFFPPSPILAWLPMVNELGFVRAIRMDHMEKMVNKICCEENNIDEEEMKKLIDPNCEYFEVRDIEKIKDFRGLQPDPNLYACEDKIIQTIREISGFSELVSGSIPYSKIAATTSAIAAQHSAVRFQHSAQVVKNFIKDCAKDLFMIIREYQEYPVSIRITSDPNVDLATVDRKMLDGEFTFDILVEDMTEASRQEKIKLAYDDLTALAPFPETKNRALIQKYLESRGHINVDELMNPPMGMPVDPMYENSQMVQGVEVPVNPNEDFSLHLRVHSEFLESPTFQQLRAQIPEQMMVQIRNIFSQHIQMTSRHYEQQQQMQGGKQQQGPPRPGVSPSIQSGQRQSGSAPVGGTTNQAGPQGPMGRGQ